MARFCVKTSLIFDTPAKRDSLSTELRDKLVDRLTGEPKMPVWGSIQLGDSVEEGKAASSLLVRFDNQADMKNLFAHIKDRMARIPVLKGRLSRHICKHDESNEPCRLDEVFV